MLPDNTFEEVWMARREFVSQFNPMTCVDGYVYGWNNLDKSFRCFDITSCEVQWYWYAPLGRGTHVLVGDQFIVFGESGQIAVVDANPQELIHSSLTKDNVPARARSVLRSRSCGRSDVPAEREAAGLPGPAAVGWLRETTELS